MTTVLVVNPGKNRPLVASTVEEAVERLMVEQIGEGDPGDEGGLPRRGQVTLHVSDTRKTEPKKKMQSRLDTQSEARKECHISTPTLLCY